MTSTPAMIDSASVKREISIEHAYRLIACGPVTLVTSFYRGDMNVMTASWLTPVSYRPVLIGLVRYCGSVSGRDQSKLTVTGLHEEGPQHIRPVLIEECIANLECAVVD